MESVSEAVLQTSAQRESECHRRMPAFQLKKAAARLLHFLKTAILRAVLEEVVLGELVLGVLAVAVAVVGPKAMLAAPIPAGLEGFGVGIHVRTSAESLRSTLGSQSAAVAVDEKLADLHAAGVAGGLAAGILGIRPGAGRWFASCRSPSRRSPSRRSPSRRSPSPHVSLFFTDLRHRPPHNLDISGHFYRLPNTERYNSGSMCVKLIINVNIPGKHTAKNSSLAMEAEETMECIQEFPEHHKMILDRLNEQREQDQFTDITLIVDGHHFKAHKAVLAACSQFFYKFFQDFTQEPLVEIEGVSNMAFRHLIEFTYTAKLMIQGEEEANDVWKAAEFLQMLEAIKALEVRNKENSLPLEENATTGKSEAKKRKIAETSNVITESLPSAESEPVEIEVEIAEGTIEVEEGLETLEEVASAEQSIKYIQSAGSSDDSALALLADITSKYRQGDRKGQIQEEDGCASDPTSKQVEGTHEITLH
uniref:Zinc finger protein 131 n=1 Tax=Sarcophilus harrisii TaxID=9305 RepID=A0A7N4PI58_SARHA